MTVERLLELLGEQVELGLAAPRLIQIAHLGEVVEQPMAPEGAELEIARAMSAIAKVRGIDVVIVGRGLLVFDHAEGDATNRLPCKLDNFVPALPSDPAEKKPHAGCGRGTVAMAKIGGDENSATLAMSLASPTPNGVLIREHRETQKRKAGHRFRLALLFQVGVPASAGRTHGVSLCTSCTRWTAWSPA